MKRPLATALLVTVALCLVGQALLAIRRLPSVEKVKAAYVSKERAILDRNGEIIDELVAAQTTRRLNWVTHKQLPPSFEELVAAQVRAPLSLKLAEILHPQIGRRQTGTAVALELAWKSHEILEAYANLAHFRGDLQGIAAASRALFDKAPAQLTRAESALTVALIDQPNATLPQARESACRLLAKIDMREECGSITLDHLAYLEKSYQIRPFIHLAPHVAKHLALAEAEGNLVRSTLDRDVQWTTMHALIAGEIENGAAIVIENATGNVLAYVADGEHDEVMRPRASGSTLGPLIYAKALDEKTLTVATPLEKAWRQTIPMGRALQANSGLAAAQALDALGVESFVQSMAAMHFADLAAPESYGPSLALGTAPIALLDVANAYRTIANDGVWSPLRFSPDLAGEYASQRVLSPQAAFIVKALLADGRPGVWLALQSSGDDWTVGFSEKYTVAVTGPSGVWREIMTALHQTATSAPPLAPPQVVRVDGDWYIAGTESTAVPEKAKASRIAYPQNHALIDWDDSLALKPLFFQIAAPRGDQNLYLNGRRLGRAEARVAWAPESGLFTLELRGSDGRLVDRVQFEVRGRRFALAH